MFNRYWRGYPLFLQLILLGLMFFIVMSFAKLIAYVAVPKLSGVPLADLAAVTEASSAKAIHAMRLLQGLSNLLIFVGTALLFAYLTHPRPTEYLGLKKPKSATNVLMAIVVMASGGILLLQIGGWMQDLNMGAWARQQQEQMDVMYKALLKMNTPGDLISNIILLAVIPAIGEEMLCRGIIMRYAYKRTRSILFAALISAAIFALLHAQPYAFVPIMVAGLLLSYIYYYTGSLWVSILVHCLYNGVQIVVAYYDKSAASNEAEHFPWYVLGIAAAVFIGSFVLLKKYATPLPRNWSDDYAPNEVPETQL